MHADAVRPEDTDWPQILDLYGDLSALMPTPVVALNRAIALAEVDGPAVALEVVDGLDLDGYLPFHATRADLLQRLDRRDRARLEWTRAADLATSDAERRFLTAGGRHAAGPAAS